MKPKANRSSGLKSASTTDTAEDGARRCPERDGYRMPPDAVAELIDAPPVPEIRPSGNGLRFALLYRKPFTTIRELARPEVRLAGLRLDARRSALSRRPAGYRITLIDIESGGEKDVTGLPEGARIDHLHWSPDDRALAFTLEVDDGLDLWTADARTGAARRIPGVSAHGAFGCPFHWMPDGQSLVCRIVSGDRGAAPDQEEATPWIQDAHGAAAAARTYSDLLTTPHRQALFAYHTRSQIALLHPDGTTAAIGRPDLFYTSTPSPDGSRLLVETLHPPLSPVVRLDRFPLRVEVWTLDGRVECEPADLPLAEDLPIERDSVRPGRRSFGWRADAPSTLVWVEALDGGDSRMATDERDRLFQWPAPFNDAPSALATLELRFTGLTWGDGSLALVHTEWWKRRWTRTWQLAPDHPERKPRLLFDHATEDVYAHPGRPAVHIDSGGQAVLQRTATGALALLGEGASPEGKRPFLDLLDPESGRKDRCWQSEVDGYEQPLALCGPQGEQLLMLRESRTEPQNYALCDIGTGERRPLTALPHPAPGCRGFETRLIHYEREDGVPLSAQIHLPPGYAAGDGPLPAVIWAYPNDCKNPAAAGQVNESAHRFVRFEWKVPTWLVALGYAVIERPAMPIIGEGDVPPNDTYLQQLVANARAAVKATAGLGVVDPDRVAAIGHSYGGFMTANLLAHSDLFRTGIARSAAYNRTLTPFGFQAEERTLWEAPEVYLRMSPFLHADRIRRPLLLIHGAEDENEGTHAMQSERFFAALKGNGTVARLVLLPHEGHAYVARESVMHMAWEMCTWLDRHLRGDRPADRAC